VHISGDFFFYPAENLPALEKSLEGVSVDPQAVSQVVEQFYAREAIESPGLQPQDFVKILIPSG
jgi:lipoate-protein ligase A